MDKSIEELLEELQKLKYQREEVINHLASKVMKYPGIEDALRDGLVRLSFPAPAGFTRSLKRK